MSKRRGRGAGEREEWLRNTILSLESGARRRRERGLVAALMRLGVVVARPAEEDDDAQIDPDDDDLIEYLKPGRGWPEAERALFWRLVAAALEDRYSDALLNLRADALDRAAGWHLAHEPDVAMVMLARRARALSYASWGEEEVLAPIDAALAVHRPGENAPAAEYEFILQACEVLDRLRSWRDEDFPRSAQVLALGLRGLELADQLGGAPQRARLHHAVADALTRDPAPIDDATRTRLVERFGAGAPAAVAEVAWRRALELEDGDFYGTVTVAFDRRDERMRQYRWGLALLDLQRGALDRALAVLEQAPSGRAYDRRRHLIRLARLLAAHGVSRRVRLDVITRALRRDVLEAAFEDEFEREQAVEYFEFGLYQLGSLGAGPEHLAVVRDIMARPGMAEGIDARRAEREEWKASARESTERLVNAMVAALEARRPRSKREAARRRAAFLASESSADRAQRIAFEVASEVMHGAGAVLLLDVGSRVSPDGDRLALLVDVNCPEFALDAVRADPAVAAVLAAIERHTREQLPGCAVEVRVRSRSLAIGPGDDPWTGPALAAAGATTALAALGIEATPPADLKQQFRLQSRRRGEVLAFA